MNLSQEQRNAVERTGQDVCVAAGPGSGKTRVLTSRFEWLISRQGLRPPDILAITFTEKAANEIKGRLVEAFSDDSALREQIERACVSTIHGFCARLLREHAVEAGLDPGFRIFGEPFALAELRRAADAALDELFGEKPEAFIRLLEAVGVTDLTTALCAVYPALRAAGARIADFSRAADSDSEQPADLHQALKEILAERAHGWNAKQRAALDALRQWARVVLDLPGDPVTRAHFQRLAGFPCELGQLKAGSAARQAAKKVRDELAPRFRRALASRFFAWEQAVLVEALERLERVYRERKRAVAALDFDDLQEYTLELLRGDDSLRRGVQRAFRQVLMDELQDTNRVQWELVSLARRPDAFFAVGDVNQSIYGFRHAEPELFHAYRRQLEQEGKRVDRLDENYRSRPEVLQAVEAVLRDAPGIDWTELSAKHRFFDKSEPSLEVIVGLGDDAVRIEAEWVARRIRELEGSLFVEDEASGGQRPAAFRDIAILVRTSPAIEELQRALEKFGVPFLVTRGGRFFDTREVTDLIHWLRVVANPRDEISMAVVLRSPLVGVHDETLLRMKLAGGSLVAALQDPDAAGAAEWDADDTDRIRAFAGALRAARAEAGFVPADQLVSRILDHSGYEQGLDARRRANIRKLLALLRGIDAGSLPETVEQLETLRATAQETEAPPDEAGNAVRIMTMHGAKGLEFPIVFCAALHKGPSSEVPALTWSPQAGLGAKWRDPATGDELDDLARHAAKQEIRRKEAEESDRLLYVAMTRAREHLVLSFARARQLARWPALVADGLGFDPDHADVAPSRHVPPGRAFAVGLLRTDQPPKPFPAPAETAREAELVYLPRPALEDQHDAAASVTSVALFQACPRRYYLARYLGWPEHPAAHASVLGREPDEIDASQLGAQVHALLAGEPVEHPASEALGLAARFQSSGFARRVATAARVEREFDFAFEIEGVVLRGRIDLWFEEGGELVLLDYKTDAVDAAGAAARVESYALQLRLYALALERLAGRCPDRAWLYFLRLDLALPVPLGRELLDSAQNSVRAFKAAQSDLRFPIREGEQCLRCGYYRGLCPAGGGVSLHPIV